jgi:hypothetical protein
MMAIKDSIVRALHVSVNLQVVNDLETVFGLLLAARGPLKDSSVKSFMDEFKAPDLESVS